MTLQEFRMSNDLSDELLSFVCGKQIGSGLHRLVYEFELDPKFVIKVAIDRTGGRAVNQMEYEMWSKMDQTPIQRWFAPVLGVSLGGKYLIQKRVESLPKKQYPKKIPHFFTDTKYSNFGWLPDEGRFVCCDYGSFNMFRGVSTKMVKANWWE